jgi:hypothetical protein
MINHRAWNRTILIILFIVVLSLITILSLEAAPSSQTADVVVTVNHQMPDGMSRLSLGVTHTQFSLDWGGEPDAVRSAKQMLRESTHFQNQHIMGWGANNPEPSPGEYNWASLDSRIAMIRSMGAEPVITLCCAPDWMKGGPVGSTDWTNLEAAPLSQHYDDFAELARQVALRYPDVRYYQVWNEMKGLWDSSNNNWDYVAYTELYNRVYDALKSVNPEIHVGGFYMVIEGTGSDQGHWATSVPITPRQITALDYWLQHKHGADFIALNHSLQDYHDPNSYTTAELMALTPVFGEIAQQVRARTNLPIWWAEYYVSGTDEGVAARNASVFYHMLKGDSSVALLWNPMEGEINYPLFSDVRVAGGGQPLPNYHQFRIFHQHFGEGTQLYQATSSSPDVEVLASSNAILLINKRNAEVTVNLNGTLLTLAAYEVRLLGEPELLSP